MIVSAYYETHKSIDAQQAAAILQEQIDEYTKATGHFVRQYASPAPASDDEDEAGSWVCALDIRGLCDLDALSLATGGCLDFEAGCE